MRENKSEDKINAEGEGRILNKWFLFFNKYSFLGIILILISAILHLSWDEYWTNLISEILSTIGIALMIGAIFDFSKNSQAFTEFISNILKDIIVSKAFLKELEETSKKEALELILKPSDNQLEQCSNINDYFKKRISESLEMFHTNFKTDLSLVSQVRKESGKVCTDSVLTYRIYKIENEYEPIITTFERESSNIGTTKILYPGGHRIITEEDIRTKGETIDSRLIFYKFEIPEDLYKYPYLTIQKEVKEIGYDHWTNVNWTTLTPTDGIKFQLICHDDLTIKEHLIFDDNDLYDIHENKNHKEMSIISSSWLNKSTGFCITVSDTKIKDEKEA